MSKLVTDNAGWVTTVINGRWVQAKVGIIPSYSGINKGKVFKLAIGKTSHMDQNKGYFDQLDYNYDRGLNFDKLPSGILDSIISELESIDQDESCIADIVDKLLG